MPDDLDDLLRAAMKTLDDQVPSGYFEALPNQTLARLEGSSMQEGTSGTTENRGAVAPPIVAPPQASAVPAEREREEDSGLHDIRNLAQSTKQRLSSRRSTQNPPIADDALAASSGSWKNIALPQPAKMVSLPELAELPAKQDVVAAERAAKEAEKAAKEAEKAAKEAEKAAKEAEKAARKAKKDKPEEAAAAPIAPAAPAVEPAPVRQAFSLPSQQNKRNWGPTLAVAGTGLAAAAGLVIFLQMGSKSDDAPPIPSASSTPAEADKAPAPPEPEPVTPPPPVEAPVAEAAPMELATADEPEATKQGTDDRKAKAKPAKKDHTVVIEDKRAPEEKKVETKPAPEVKKPGGKDDEAEPSFDALLKEAGVDAARKEAKPKLEKKSLTGDDFKKGMAAVAAKAQACYSGTQGTASLKLTIAPSGQVSKVTVSGQFASSPEGTCVANAVKAATFPPWDGGPMSFTYAYMLAD